MLRSGLILSLTLVPSCASLESTGMGDDRWPSVVLITNDDGIEDEQRLITMARAFRDSGCETVVVAVPRLDRSGSSHFLTLGNPRPEISVERLARHEVARGGPTTAFYVVDGYPADCVLFAISGPMCDRLPDLVVSGINGGANLAEGWIGSGTIGAARVAAYLGVPGLAISGLDEQSAGAAEPVAEWVARLARAAVVRNLPHGGYLTDALPVRPFDELAGVRVAHRSALTRRPILARRETNSTATTETWQLTGFTAVEPSPGSDVTLHADGYVVITPMRADEDDAGAIDRLRSQDFPALHRAKN